MSLQELPASSVPLPWHRGTWEAVIRQYGENQLAHALLLLGPPGSGKRQFALALARLLLCTGDAREHNCGHCHACELSAAGNNGDLLWLQPEEKSRVIKIDQVRSAITFTHSTINFSATKVVVFAPAHSMNISAHNALLKSLEEPAANTYLILVCDSLAGVPATIRSRCRLQRLPEAEPALSLDWLEGVTGDRARAEQLLTVSGGRPLLAQSLYLEDTEDAYVERKLAMRALLQRKLDVTDIWNAFGDVSPDAFLQLMAEELQLRIRALGTADLAGEGKTLFRLLDEVLHLQRAVNAGSNPARQMLVDQMLSKSHRELGPASQGDTI